MLYSRPSLPQSFLSGAPAALTAMWDLVMEWFVILAAVLLLFLLLICKIDLVPKCFQNFKKSESRARALWRLKKMLIGLIEMLI